MPRESWKSVVTKDDVNFWDVASALDERNKSVDHATDGQTEVLGEISVRIPLFQPQIHKELVNMVQVLFIASNRPRQFLFDFIHISKFEYCR